MNDFFVRRRTIALAGLSGVALLAACRGEDKRVKELTQGITRDSAVSVMAQEAKMSTSDSLPNVYTTALYIINGKKYEVLYFTPDNKKFMKDSVSLNELTPVLFVDNKLYGKGWDMWDSVSKANNIPLQDRSEKKAKAKK